MRNGVLMPNIKTSQINKYSREDIRSDTRVTMCLLLVWETGLRSAVIAISSELELDLV